MTISVKSSSDVSIRAPLHAQKTWLLELIDKKENWIKKHLLLLQHHQPLREQPQYEEGAGHLFLGITRRLVLHKSPVCAATLKDNSLYIHLKNHGKVQIANALEQFYRSQAEQIFSDQLNHLFSNTFASGFRMPELKIRKMKSRWGSYSSRHQITLNLHLIKAHPECIEYVIMHELCHMVHLNHSRDFYKLLSEKMPDWKERKRKLNSSLFLSGASV